MRRVATHLRSKLPVHITPTVFAALRAVVGVPTAGRPKQAPQPRVSASVSENSHLVSVSVTVMVSVSGMGGGKRVKSVWGRGGEGGKRPR